MTHINQAWTTIERLSVDDPDRWFRIMPVGTFERFGRRVQVTRDDIGEIVRNWLRGIPDSVLPVNRAHQNAEGRVGHIASLDARADGLYARINWLPDGLELLRAGAFRYVSPEIIWGETDFEGRRVRNVLMGLALENSPFFGEKVAIYSLEKAEEGHHQVEDQLQGKEESMAIQERGLRDAVKSALADLGIKVGRDAEHFSAVLAERDQLRAEVEAVEHAIQEQMLITKYTNVINRGDFRAPRRVPQLLATVALHDQEAADGLAQEYSALAAQVDEGTLFEETGTSTPEDNTQNPTEKFMALVKRRAGEKNIPEANGYGGNRRRTIRPLRAGS